MAGHTSWRDIRASLGPEAIARIDRRVEAILCAMELGDLRDAREISLEELDARLSERSWDPPATRTDPRISVLRDVIEAMGGELRIIAHFADADYRIDQFERAAEAAD